MMSSSRFDTDLLYQPIPQNDCHQGVTPVDRSRLRRGTLVQPDTAPSNALLNFPSKSLPVRTQEPRSSTDSISIVHRFLETETDRHIGPASFSDSTFGGPELALSSSGDPSGESGNTRNSLFDLISDSSDNRRELDSRFFAL